MSDCIEAPGCRDKDGYAIVGGRRYGSRFNVRAHRAVWIDAHGPLPKGALVLHSCDNPGCINVEHLRIGTHDDNMRDRRTREREPYGNQSTSDLTENEVCWMRKLHRVGRMSLREIGSCFGGLTKGTVHKIVKYKTWPHVSDAYPQPQPGSRRVN